MPGNYSLTSPGDIPQSGTQSIGYDPLVELLMGARTSDQGSGNQPQDTGGAESQAALSQGIQDQLGQQGLDAFAQPDASLTKPTKVNIGAPTDDYSGLMNALNGPGKAQQQTDQSIMGSILRNNGGKGDTAGALGGAAIGGVYGGPAGATIGGQLGPALVNAGSDIWHGITGLFS